MSLFRRVYQKSGQRVFLHKLIIKQIGHVRKGTPMLKTVIAG